jgi:DNA-binding XRE family transcriptional regulator
MRQTPFRYTTGGKKKKEEIVVPKKDIDSISTIGFDTILALKRIREEEKITLEEVAQRMGLVHKSSIHSIERMEHDPKMGTVQRYAAALGYDVEVLLIPREEG